MAFSNKTASILLFSIHLSLWFFTKKYEKRKNQQKPARRSRFKNQPPKSTSPKISRFSNCLAFKLRSVTLSVLSSFSLHKHTTPYPLCFGKLDVKFETELPKKNRKLSFCGGNFFVQKTLLKLFCLFVLVFVTIFIKIPPFFGHRFWPLILFFVIPKSIQTSDLQIDGPNLASASDRWFSEPKKNAADQWSFRVPLIGGIASFESPQLAI